jgi:membrane-associated phospholipid phosphatase
LNRSDVHPESSPRRQIALILSVIGHPFLFTPVVALVSTWLLIGPAAALIGIGTIIVACLLPASIYITRQVKRGLWSDLDVSKRGDRPHLYTVAGALLLIAILILWLSGQSPLFIRGCLAALLLMLSGWLLNRWFKPSMHAGFAMLTGCSLWPFGIRLVIPALFFALLVGWSRIELERHTVGEVAAGLVLGAIMAGGLLL